MRKKLRTATAIEMGVLLGLDAALLVLLVMANVGLAQGRSWSSTTLIWVSFFALVIYGFSVYFLAKMREYVKSTHRLDGKFLAYCILNIVFGLSVSGIMGIVAFVGEKKEKEPLAERGASLSLYVEERPQYEEGYDAESGTVIRLVSRKKKKDEAPYQVRGIEDVAAKNNWKGWLYLAPVIVLVAVFLIYPLINTIFISFTENYSYASGEFEGLTLNNFTYILGLTTKPNGARETYFTRYAIPNTFILTFVTVPLSTLLALLISVALNSIKKFQKFFQTVFFLPYVTNAIAVGMVFSVIFDDQGVINYIFHTTTTWIYGANQWTAMVPLVLYVVWGSIPFKILILLSGLQGVDKQYYQAAMIDSAPKRKVLWRITVPLLSPQILYILITSFIGAFKEYTHIVGLFNGPGTLGNAGDPNMETIVYYIYNNLSTNTSAAAAAAVFLFVIILIFTGLQFWASRKRVYY
jgi:multiple sugar transport system permease protein